MLKEENDLLTRVGPGTPCGEMIRRYWIPAALSAELPAGGAPLPIRLLGEDLVLFRDDRGQPGLLGLHCAHRGADLSYGRVEDGGLRCIYHGWLYDAQGNCREQPGEPQGQAGLASEQGSASDNPLRAAGPARLYQKIKQRAYPCHEEAEVIYAYMGPNQPPLFPNYEPYRVPADHLFVDKYFQNSNYLQGNEGNIDSVHLKFLHRFMPGSRYAWNGAGGQVRSVAPRWVPKWEDTHFGVRVFHSYEQGDGPHVNINNFIMPVAAAVNAVGPDGYVMNWHVPIDDTHHWSYTMTFRRSKPIEREPADVDEKRHLLQNQANRYRQNREEQKSDTFAGLGPQFAAQDALVVETAGEVYDRSQEHTAPTDSGIVALRKMMLRGIQDVQEGRDPPNVIRDPDQQDRLLEITVGSWLVPQGATWDQERRSLQDRGIVPADQTPAVVR